MAALTPQQAAAAQALTHYVLVQVWRSGNWITLPITKVEGDQATHRSGTLTITIPDMPGDTRSRLYEGERIRAYRGTKGGALTRCFTGFVDAPSPTIDGLNGLSRSYVCTDNLKELVDAIMLDGVIYDNMKPNDAAIDVLNRAISKGQYVIYDDNGNQLNSTASYTQANGNGVVYFPDLVNDDGSVFVLPSGTLGSFTNPTTAPVASLMIPPASGQQYSVFELPQRYIIASTMTVGSMTQASNGGLFPPASGSYYLDSYNGLLYFNVADVGKVVDITGVYYESPLFAYQPGSKMFDVIEQVMQAAGNIWTVDGFGKLNSQYVDIIGVPKRVYAAAQVSEVGVDITRDRRNVCVALGWDNNCGQILCAVGVNYNDVNNPPPLGLGKRAYMIAQDNTWQTQYAVSKVAYYMLQQASKRGKLLGCRLPDDAGLNLNDVIAFQSVIPEITPNDFFVLDNIKWQLSAKDGTVADLMTLGGGSIPGQGMFYLGPAIGVTPNGALDFSIQAMSVLNATLIPAGGTYQSTFSASGGLQIQYATGALPGQESITIYGSDSSQQVVTSNIARPANQLLTYPLYFTAVPGVLYVVKMWWKDTSGNISVYRDWIYCLP